MPLGSLGCLLHLSVRLSLKLFSFSYPISRIPEKVTIPIRRHVSFISGFNREKPRQKSKTALHRACGLTRAYWSRVNLEYERDINWVVEVPERLALTAEDDCIGGQVESKGRPKEDQIHLGSLNGCLCQIDSLPVGLPFDPLRSTENSRAVSL